MQELPLNVYIHVPKTGGTSLKNWIKDNDPFGVENIEKFTTGNNFRHITDWDLPMLPSRLSWIGGHTNLVEAASAFILYRRNINYFSSVRIPEKQVASHLNFIATRTLDGMRSGKLSDKDFPRDFDIASTDFSDVKSIIHTLLRHKDFLLNNQIRTVIGPDFEILTDTQINDRIKRYTFISTELNIDGIIYYMGYEGPITIDRLNESRYIFDPHIFYSDEMCHFLNRFNSFDNRLYHLVSKYIFDEKRTIRPTYVFGVEFDDANFREDLYLFSCPDVEIAVRRGEIESGLAHFQAFGREERRRMVLDKRRSVP